MFCGSATWRRWKSAPAGNSSVSVSSREGGRRRLGQEARNRDRALADGVDDAPVPCLADLLELDGRRGRGVRRGRLTGRASTTAAAARRRCARGGRRGRSARAPSSSSTRCASDSRERSAGGPGHLHEGELEREPGVRALPDVLDGDREEVDEPEHRGLGELVCLLAKALLRLLGDRKRLGDVAHVLHEQQVPQVLQEVDHDATEVLSLLGELLEEEERARRVAVDDCVAEPQERLLVDGSDELENRLGVDRVVRRGGELVEGGDGVAEGAAR